MPEQPEAPENPLQRFVGSWRGEVTVEARGAEPERYVQENTFAWVLGHLFLEERGTGSNGSSFLGVWSLDAQSRKYRAHYFLAPSADAVVLTHEWDAANQKFVGSAELGGGVRMLAEDTFLDADTYEWRITVRDGTGQTLTSMRARERRVRSLNHP
jgi:hypothetical protein